MHRSSSLVVALVVATAASAQNSFRPLPELPDLHDWPGPAARTSAALRFDELEAQAEAPREKSFVEVRALADVSSSADFDGGGSLASQSGGWVATLGTQLGDERIAALSIRTEAFFYNLGGANDLVPGENEPFNDLYRASISGLVRSSAEGAPGWFGGFHLSLGGEDDAATNESLVVGATGGVRYKPSESLDLELGVAALSRLEDDAWIWPYVGFRWRAKPWLEFSAQGTSLEASALVSDHWRLMARAEYSLRQFRLNDDNPLPSGVLRDEEIRAGVGVEYTSGSGFGVELLAGLNLWRELSTVDRAGQAVNEDELDVTPFVALALSLSL